MSLSPPRQASFFLTLPVPCSDRKSPFLVPSLQSRNYRSARSLSKRASWRGTGRFLPLPWQKIPDPLLTGEDAEIRSRTDGAQPSSNKNFSPLGLSVSPSCPVTIRRVSKAESHPQPSPS